MSRAPAQLHLTFKKEVSSYEDGDYSRPIFGHPLAFAHAYEPKIKSFAKKKETQMKWAYGTWPPHEERDGVWITEHDRHGWSTGQNVIIKMPAIRVDNLLQPRVIDNTPTSGFMIAKSVTRHKTSKQGVAHH